MAVVVKLQIKVTLFNHYDPRCHTYMQIYLILLGVALLGDHIVVHVIRIISATYHSHLVFHVFWQAVIMSVAFWGLGGTLFGSHLN